MKKLIIAILVVFVLVGACAFLMNSNEESNTVETQNTVNNENETPNETTALEINSAEDLSAVVDKLYEGKQDLYPSLMTQPVDVTDKDTVSYMTGLENGDDLEYLVVSEPMMSSQAYSLILAKVKDGADADQVAKTMNENIDYRKWICVAAEKIYSTSSGNLVCLVMSSEEMAKPIYDEFKSLVGNVGQEYERVGEEAELPVDDNMMEE